MINDAEERISKFYNNEGWQTQDEITEDAKQFEDLREHAREYVSKCRMRVLRHIPASGDNILDMASGPIQYKEYLEYSKGFKKRYCVDLSDSALEEARKKIGDHGEYLHGSFFDLDIEENFFDCAISLHTIYHMDKDMQEQAVRKLLAVTKPGKPVIIIYGNPNTYIESIKTPIRAIAGFLRKITLRAKANPGPLLYVHEHPISWWYRFSDTATVDILPWRSFGSHDQKRLIPDNKLGKMLFNMLFKLEDRFPKFFVKHFQYPMIILRKK